MRRTTLRTSVRAFITALTIAAIGGGAMAAKPNLRAFFASDFTDAAYQQKTFEKVGKAWKRPAEMPEAGSKSVVIATILRDGSLLERKLHHESGSKAWDEAAMNAVKAAAPLDPLPKSYPRTSVEVHFHFEVIP